RLTRPTDRELHSGEISGLLGRYTGWELSTRNVESGTCDAQRATFNREDAGAEHPSCIKTPELRIFARFIFQCA
ncbi:MAG: hypothetical protein ACP5MD_05145, partial [Verrucomicrobiia bacterium]